MNYAKIIDSAIQLFPKRIKVTLIDADTGIKLGKHKVPAQQLPSAFNRPTTLEIDNISWRVFKAMPVSADDFLYSKKLTLHVQHATQVNSNQLRYPVPTIIELPVIGPNSSESHFVLELDETDWRQIEFLPNAILPEIEETIKTVEAILKGQPEPLLGYEQQHGRFIPNPLALPFDGFYELVNGIEKGVVQISDHGFVQNGFAIRSDSYTYYGVQENGIIQALSITQFDSFDDELMAVLNGYELVMCDWCNANVLSIVSTEGMPENAILI